MTADSVRRGPANSWSKYRACPTCWSETVIVDGTQILLQGEFSVFNPEKGAHWYPLSRRKEEGQRSQHQESENVTVWWSACPASMKSRVIFPTWPTLGMVVHACSYSNGEVDTRGSEIQSDALLQRPCSDPWKFVLKQNKKKNPPKSRCWYEHISKYKCLKPFGRWKAFIYPSTSQLHNKLW